MKVSDYIVAFLIKKSVTDVFGYPGGMVTHLMDSFDKYQNKITAHLTYHEQGASFCACGYAQISQKPGIAYATSGPGVTNLFTGIANAYFDSIPCIFITGQVNTYESKGNLKVRQKGFQEMDAVHLVKGITKYATQITKPEEIRYALEKAFSISLDGRPGPVLLDIPMNIQRADIDPENLRPFKKEQVNLVDDQSVKDRLFDAIQKAKKPLIIAGAGISASGYQKNFLKLVQKLKISVVTSMIAVDCLPQNFAFKFGFIGTYGHRYANFAIAKSDLIISLGSRLDCRQTGSNKAIFAENAKLIRIDIDSDEMTNQIKEGEVQFTCDIKQLIPTLLTDEKFSFGTKYDLWLHECEYLKQKLKHIDHEPVNTIVRKISKYIPENVVITTDVGQNQVWVAQDFIVKQNQRILFSGGHGAMGYSLPAAIGAYYASKKTVICFVGDGGLQMNIQELQFIVREQIPIKVILLNNASLGMIRHFQEMYFNAEYMQTVAQKGYTIPDFNKIAEAYKIEQYTLQDLSEYSQLEKILGNDKPAFINVICGDKTYIYPKLAMDKPIYDQEPPIPRVLLNELLVDG